MRNLLEQIRVAEQAGLDFFGVGEHHTASMPDSPLVTWESPFRPPLKDALVVPRPDQPIPIWLGTGGMPHARCSSPSSCSAPR